MPFKLVREKVLFTARVFKLQQEVWSAPDGKKFERSTITHPGAVAILPFDNKGRLLLIKQFRPAVRDFLLEIPAGTLEKGEKPLACAKRELIEETGFAAKKWQALGYIFTAPGFCSERIFLFAAWDLSPAYADQDDDEHIAPPTAMTLQQVKKAVTSGKICDGKTLSSLLQWQWRK
jgi:ADP-ribose pyrophosphatase